MTTSGPKLFIVGYVPANNEVWVIGDSFLNLAAQHLEYWKALARRDPHEALYMLHWYNVKAVIPQSTTSNSAEIITASLVAMLNNRPKLPHTLVMLLGDTKFWCEDNALKYCMDTILIGLLKEIKRIIALRQSDLPPKAVAQDPLLYFIKLHWKPDNAVDSVPMYPKKRRTFNKLLDTIMRPRGVHTISLNEITVKIDKNFFLNHGSLSELGLRQIWKSLSNALSDYDTYGYQQLIDFELKTQNQKLAHHSSNDSDVGDTNQEEDYFNFRPINSKRKKSTTFLKSKNKGRGRAKNTNFSHNNY